jgi:predicted  nucleic acid-binding Zn-ribbon protein
MYCLNCKIITETINPSNSITKNNRNMLKGTCADCGRIKCQFVKSNAAATSGGDLVGMLNTISKNFKLPLQKFPGELHIPGMNFAGPGTRLDYRLNDNGTPKSYSRPVDRVDQAAYYHDLAYNQHKDTENRNIADREMLQQLDSIDNPSVREKIKMAIIKPIINTKQRFGLGWKDRVARDFRSGASIRSPMR